MKKCLDIKKGFVSLHHTTRVLLNRHKIGCLMSFQLKDGFFKPKTLYYDFYNKTKIILCNKYQWY
jgi:hypothetical protein